MHWGGNTLAPNNTENLLTGKVKGTDEYGRKKVSLEDATGSNDVGNVLDNFYRNHLLTGES